MADDPDPTNFDLPPSVQIIAGLAALVVICSVGCLVLLGLMRGVRGLRDAFGGG